MEKRIAPNGLEHGLVNTLINHVPRSRRGKGLDPKKKEELETQVKHNMELLTVRYINYKNQENGQFATDYTAGAGEPVFMFRFLHNYVYQLPRGLVEKINGPNMEVQKREGTIDENGNPREKDGPKRRIHQFVRDIVW